MHLNIFQANFSVKYGSLKDKNYWITQGINVSYKTKQACMTSLRTAVIQKQVYFIKYCKILRKVIKEAKKQHCSRLTAKSNYKITTVGNILKKDTGTRTFMGTGYHLTCE
jgi:hypothetical protein